MKSCIIFLFVVMFSSCVWVQEILANPGIIPVAKFNSSTMSGGIPQGWKLEKKTGRPLMNLEKAGNSFYLRLISKGDSSFGIRKEARVDIKKFPILNWRWMV
ncbi:MAG: hypothetical protein ABRQ31_03820, partial [Smithellaceae bacterium]